MNPITIGAIALGLDNSQSGGYCFMNLNTGKRIHRRSWTKLPVPNEVVKRVEQLGRCDKQHELLIFTDKHGNEYKDDPKDHPDADTDDDLSYGTEYEPEVKQTTGVNEVDSVASESSIETPTPSFQDINPIHKVMKEASDNKVVLKEAPDHKVISPSKAVFDVSLPDKVPKLYDDNASPTVVEDSPSESTPIVSNVEEPTGHPAYKAEEPTGQPGHRRSTRVKTKVDRYDPSFTQTGKSRRCDKKLRKIRSKSPRHQCCFIQLQDLEELDHDTLIKYVCLTSIAEGHGAPSGVNLLDIAKMSKLFAQTSKTTSKPEKYSLNRGLKSVQGKRTQCC